MLCTLFTLLDGEVFLAFLKCRMFDTRFFPSCLYRTEKILHKVTVLVVNHPPLSVAVQLILYTIH